MRILKISLVCVFVMLGVSCKSARSVVASGKVNSKLTAKQLIKENGKREANFKTLQAKVKIDIIQDLKESSYTVNLRMERDKTIWISATLGLARAMITPDRVRFYDKINNQYFDGNYKLLSDLLGVDLNFNKVQSLLIGEPLYNLKDDNYIISINENSYVLQPKNQSALLELFLLFNPSHFKMDSQQLLQPLKKRFLQIDYLGYQDVDKEVLPQDIKIIAVEDSEELNVIMEYKSVSVNGEVRFPFKIPSGFDEIILEDAN
ncbi:deoxyuridine 5'-triphosphate nucleotidohydrolase [Flavobacteriales bacterium 33_180_T64]|nr:deoxyuridine 5'-triphosphate nucleotidohydrolase [Flavobacteriales bacterium 33_180_T64]